MSSNFKTGVAARNAALDAKCALLNGGTIKIYDGSPPTNPGDASTGTLLATLTFGSPAFNTASSGTTTAHTITSDTSASGSGTAGYFRMRPSGGSDTSAVYQGTVGTSGADLNLSGSGVITIGDTVSISAYTLTDPDIC
jgi:hypothetical protein